ncbi:MAG TPA: sigma-54-dependent Fis family transcriptional regulator [candidate division WOR-3 bacterium]|uniref:Sigma-54-dependent Fis family transcriptional regulator n=1 Tax=candidate division WOR-3 bacterium TaxID=2052148 RepID=A0A9C9JZD0_UNCW3|nr:sigma-54-dependent Fis family transcriptional regulator [candidate division WOR-3 bacterium]
MDKFKILIVDDEPKICRILEEILEAEGYATQFVLNGTDAIKKLEKNDIDMVLLDIKLPDIDGITLLKKFKKMKPELLVIMISAFGTVQLAVEALKSGAEDFIEKPLETNRILTTIKSAFKKFELKKQRDSYRTELLKGYQIIGKSEVVKELLELIKKFAATESIVLILGETGTGKELVAHNLHFLSRRAGAPFIKVNCAALPGELIESELFGYERGAFTGASRQKKGYFEAAQNGTLFLDEIGDMPLSAQAKVLHSIEEQEIFHLGGTKPIKIDVRIICATNQNLSELIEARKFREDLYHRINVLSITIPPLRERVEDIPVLARYFLENACFDNNIPVKKFSSQALNFLKNFTWPGNVRQLKHLMSKIAILIDEPVIKVAHIKKILSFKSIEDETYIKGGIKAAQMRFEREHIIKTLNENNWQISETARSLGIDRSTLFRKMKKLGIKR